MDKKMPPNRAGYQHHFEERAVFVGRGVRAVGTNDWQPRSECSITSIPLDTSLIAIFRAAMGPSVLRLCDRHQPIISRVNLSVTRERYAKASPIFIYVISQTWTWFGALTTRFFVKFDEIGRLASHFVVLGINAFRLSMRRPLHLKTSKNLFLPIFMFFCLRLSFAKNTICDHPGMGAPCVFHSLA